MLVSEERAARTASRFIVVYPTGFALGGAAAALDAAGIPHRAGTFPETQRAGEPQAVVYLIELSRLGTLGVGTIADALALLAAGGRATTVLVAERGSGDTEVAALPGVGGWLTAPLDPPAVVAALRAAGATLAADERARRLDDEAERLLQIGVALSAERDLGALQRSILRSARELTRADSGSLYLLEPDGMGGNVLRFAVAQTGPTDAGTHLGALLPLAPTSISGYVALSGGTVRIDDAYQIPGDAVYRFNRSFDEANGYRTKSVLAVPMRDHDDTIVGVLMLINRKPAFHDVLHSAEEAERVVLPFGPRDERVLLSLASQAGVALENKALLDAIHELFEQFVGASVKAIEVRDRATQGHSARVADLTVRQAKAINDIAAGPYAGVHFDADQMRELRYAALLHDFGKVAVPEYIFAKAKKLPEGRLETIRLRFLLALEQARGDADREELLALLAQVEAANEPRVVGEAADAALDRAAERTYREAAGEHPLLAADDLAFLRIARGSLSETERRRMEDHVSQSFAFLREIPWSKTPWPNVPDLAHGHHELLDGTGYPLKLRGDQIAPQVRMLTISDVFDALTANDRPYKPALSAERALDILGHEFAARGKVDRDLLDVFVARELWKPSGPKDEAHA